MNLKEEKKNEKQSTGLIKFHNHAVGFPTGDEQTSDNERWMNPTLFFFLLFFFLLLQFGYFRERACVIYSLI